MLIDPCWIPLFVSILKSKLPRHMHFPTLPFSAVRVTSTNCRSATCIKDVSGRQFSGSSLWYFASRSVRLFCLWRCRFSSVLHLQSLGDGLASLIHRSLTLSSRPFFFRVLYPASFSPSRSFFSFYSSWILIRILFSGITCAFLSCFSICENCLRNNRKIVENSISFFLSFLLLQHFPLRRSFFLLREKDPSQNVP